MRAARPVASAAAKELELQLAMVAAKKAAAREARELGLQLTKKAARSATRETELSQLQLALTGCHPARLAPFWWRKEAAGNWSQAGFHVH
jgi:hypothetical protein